MQRFLANTTFIASTLLLSATLTFAAEPAKKPDASANPKYVFLFIGDGMSMTQVNSAEIYSNAIGSKDIAIKKLRFSQFPAVGMTTTYEAGSFITDSASAGTAMASGNKTLSGVINMDPGKTIKYKTIAEQAKAAGYKIGIVSSVSLDHATPASFYAKVPSRGDMYDIAVQLTQSGFDYFGGGGFAQSKGKKNDQPDVIGLAKQAGYTYVNTKADFAALKPGAGKVLAVNATLQDAFALPYEMDRKPDDLSLADYTRKGIELLDNRKGFFMMVEGGKIDWAGHANDAMANISDVIALDNAVAEAMAFQERHPKETLIIVTGDHETGGMTIGFAGTKYSTFYDKISKQNMSFQAFTDGIVKKYKAENKGAANFADWLPVIEQHFGLKATELSPDEKVQLERAFTRSMGGEVEKNPLENDYLLYGGYDPLTVKLTQILNQHAGIGWTTYSHTGVPVTTFAKGRGQEQFLGYYDNTDIYRKLVRLLRLPVATRLAAN